MQLRGELVSRAIDGLIREVQLDQANGLIGKTAIHPGHVAVVNALSVVSAEEYRDARDLVQAGRAGGVMPSGHRNKMNEIRPHLSWAQRTMLRSQVFGSRPRVCRSSICWREPLVTASRPVVARTTVARLGVRLHPRRRARSTGAARARASRQPTAGAAVGLAGAGQARAHRPAGGPRGRAAARRAGRRHPRRRRSGAFRSTCCTPRSGRRRAPRRALHARPPDGVAAEPVNAAVLGFAETATALGHCVAEALGGADYLHSTRRPVAGVATAGAFVEEHSHHTGHLLLPSDPGLLAGPRPLVLVDDELSTGRTAVNTIAALHRTAPRARYVLATLVDLREDALAGLPDGVRVDVVALGRAELTLPVDLAERAAALRAELAAAPTHLARAEPPPHRRVLLTDLGWPAGLPAGGRHGFTGDHHRLLAAALPQLGQRLARAADVRPGERRSCSAPRSSWPRRCAWRSRWPRRATTSGSPPPPAPPSSPSTTPATPSPSGLVFPAHDDPADGPGSASPTTSPGRRPRRGRRRSAADTPDLHAPGCSPRSPHTRAARGGGHARDRSIDTRAPARPRLRLLPARRGRLAAQGPLGRRRWRRRPRSARRRSRAAGRTTRSRCPSSTSPSRRTRSCSTRRSATSAGRIAQAVGVVTELVLAERGPASCSCRWPGRAPRSAC